MNTFLTILLVLGAFTAYLYFRHLRIKYELKDSNYGGVQNMPRLIPEKNHSEAFLPGSRSENVDSLQRIAKVMEEGLEIKKFSKKKRSSGRMFSSKKDFKRAYIIDALLERPKW